MINVILCIIKIINLHFIDKCKLELMHFRSYRAVISVKQLLRRPDVFPVSLCPDGWYSGEGADHLCVLMCCLTAFLLQNQTYQDHHLLSVQEILVLTQSVGKGQLFY